MKRILLVSCLVPHGIAIQCGPAAVLCTAVVAIKNIRHLGISLGSHFVSSNYEGRDSELYFQDVTVKLQFNISSTPKKIELCKYTCYMYIILSIYIQYIYKYMYIIIIKIQHGLHNLRTFLLFISKCLQLSYLQMTLL